MTDPNSQQPRELRYKEDFAKAFTSGRSHWGDELSMGMLAEYASQLACDLITRATREARRVELQNILDVATRNEDALGWAEAYSSVCDVAAMRLAELDSGEDKE